MGRQVSFYMDSDDEAEFVAFLRLDPEVMVISYASSSPEPTALDALPQQTVPGWWMLWLWDGATSARPVFRFVPEVGRYVIDGLRSELVEFSRSYLADDGLVRGRIWAEMDYWDLDQNPPQRVRKSERFAKWFDHLAGWIKRKGRKSMAGEYVLPGADRFKASGGRLCAVHMAPDVKHVRH